MKLMTFRAEGQVRAGAYLAGPGLALDLQLGASLLERPITIPSNSRDILAAERLNDVRDIVAAAERVIEVVPDALFGIAFFDFEWLPPIPDPSKIVCIGLNYTDHCEEQGLPAPTFPTVFAKFPSSMNHHEGDIVYPTETQSLDYEAELAFVVGKQARNVTKERAFDYIAGYMNLNDVTARDVQKSEGQWVRGKSFDTTCPTGPYLVTLDEIANPLSLAVKCRVNGETRQDSNTNRLVFGIPELVERLSRSFTLYPGDIVATGTPSGVGVYSTPPRLLNAGDTVEVEIEGLGVLRNRVTSEP